MTDAVLEGRSALVTGANHGIGAATAVELATLGADVAVSYLRFDAADDPGRPPAYGEHRRRSAEAVVAAVERLGRRCLPLEADLSDPATPACLFDAAEAALGPVSILVNNASGWRKDTFAPATDDVLGRALEPVSAETFDAQFHVDTRGGALLIAEFARRRRLRAGAGGRGAIVSLTSGGPMGFPGEVSYGAAKAALENYTMAASVELAAEGVTANVVHPPVTDTGWVTDAVREFVASSADHVHVATPEQVAAVIAWLCTPAAELVTGNILRLR
jgi:3-oxoacyl-[acyl-carrier protein] reductase